MNARAQAQKINGRMRRSQWPIGTVTVDSLVACGSVTACTSSESRGGRAETRLAGWGHFPAPVSGECMPAGLPALRQFGAGRTIRECELLQPLDVMQDHSLAVRLDADLTQAGKRTREILVATSDARGEQLLAYGQAQVIATGVLLLCEFQQIGAEPLRRGPQLQVADLTHHGAKIQGLRLHQTACEGGILAQQRV